MSGGRHFNGAGGGVDLDNTDACPLDGSCISCRGIRNLAVEVVGSKLGIFCVTLCQDCFRHEGLPNFSAVSVVRASLEHCEHLGITAEQMAAAMEGR